MHSWPVLKCISMHAFFIVDEKWTADRIPAWSAVASVCVSELIVIMLNYVDQHDHSQVELHATVSREESVAARAQSSTTCNYNAQRIPETASEF